MMTTSWERIKNTLSTINRLALGKTPPARFLRYYIVVVIIGTILLTIPLTHTNGNKLILDSMGNQLDNKTFHWYDGLFTAASAFSDTGLTVTNVSSSFNMGGQIIILILIQTGGFGYMTIKILIWKLVRKEISLSETIMIQAERGRGKLGGTVEMIIRAIIFIGIMELIGTFILTIFFYFSDPSPFTNGTTFLETRHNLKRSVWSGLFHTISAINNAGFDIIGGNSMGEYRYSYGIQATILVLFIIGGIGFPVIDEIYQKIKSKFKGTRTYYFSVYVKISLFTYLALALIGTGLTLTFEMMAPNVEIPDVQASPVKGGSFLSWNADSHKTVWHNDAALHSKFSKVWAIIFNSMSTRNAGFSTIPIDYFTDQTQILFIALMFIGAGPSSTAGGIRTTTFAIVILSFVKLVKGKKQVHAFNRSIAPDVVLRANIVAITGVAILFLGTLILMSSAQNFNYFHDSGASTQVYSFKFSGHDALFETASAFGTTGLTTGLTPYINTYGKISLVIIMFIGQLGMTNSITVTKGIWTNQTHHQLAPSDVLIS